MINTKYNFKQWLHKAYPDIVALPIYGCNGYVLSKPLSDIDNFKYNVQQLENGRYVVFVGVTPGTSYVKDILKELNTKGIPSVRKGKYNVAAPTTFGSFRNWLSRNNIVPLNRTFCSHTTAAALFQDETASKENRSYYMYELPVSVKDDDLLITDHPIHEVFINNPYKAIVNTDGTPIVVVLIKACNSTYKSKKQLFAEKFALMQPLYEKLISSCAKAEAMDEIQPGTGISEWQQAKDICEQYMGIQFEITGSIDLEKMKEAFNEGYISIWTRDRQNLSNNASVEDDDF